MVVPPAGRDLSASQICKIAKPCKSCKVKRQQNLPDHARFLYFLQGFGCQSSKRSSGVILHNLRDHIATVNEIILHHNQVSPANGPPGGILFTFFEPTSYSCLPYRASLPTPYQELDGPDAVRTLGIHLSFGESFLSTETGRTHRTYTEDLCNTPNLALPA